MANNFVVKDGNGSSVTFRSTDDGGGLQIPNHRVCDSTATNFMPTMDAAARPGFVKLTDGTNTAPTMDAAARKGFVALTDGTNTITVKAASTGALATDTALVVRPMMPTDGTNTQPAMDAVARAGFQSLTDGTNGPVAVKAASTIAAATDKALVVRPMMPSDGTNMQALSSSVSVLASSARTTTQTSADITVPNARAIHVILDMTVVGTGSVTLTINAKDAVSGKYYPLLTGAAVTTNSTNVYRVGPGLTASANATANDAIPITLQIVVTANNANAATYSVGLNVCN